MQRIFSHRLVRGPFAIAIASSCCSQAALATCGTGQVAANAGFGPPSISVAESSTAQVLEEIRRRQLAASQQQGQGTSQTAAEETPPAETEQPSTEAASTETPSAETPSTEAASSKAPQEPAPSSSQQASAQGQGYGAEPSYEPKGFYEATVGNYADIYGRRRAAWGRGFLGWDRHSNLAPGQQENPTRNEITGGAMAGMDWTSQNSSREKMQIGIFGGYLANNARFSSTQFTLRSPGTDADLYRRTGNRQEINGGFVGTYLTYRKNSWFSNLALKTDIFNLSQKSILTQLQNAAGTPCGNNSAVGVQSGDSSLTSLVLAGNLAKRLPHGENQWIAPTAGFRFSSTWFGSNTSVTSFSTNPGNQLSSLGLQDGQALRLQGGIRYGGHWTSESGAMWETEVAALAYSDVWISGFTFVSTSGGTVTPVDEGKVRALGQLVTKVTLENGISYLFQGDVYGGQDLIGLSGELGVRYEW